MKTKQDVENLKEKYPSGYMHDDFEIEEAEGFEDYQEELKAFRIEKDAERTAKIKLENIQFQKKASAFPAIESDYSYGGDFNGLSSRGGLTKREMFAAMAMQAMAATCHSLNDMEYIPRRAIQIADALIDELNK